MTLCRASCKDSTSVPESFLLGTPWPFPQHKTPGITKAYQANFGVFRNFITLEVQGAIFHHTCAQRTVYLVQVEYFAVPLPDL